MKLNDIISKLKTAYTKYDNIRLGIAGSYANLRNQNKITETIKHFGCNQNDLDKNEMAFDLCAFYMAQIGEAAKLLTEDTKKSLGCYR